MAERRNQVALLRVAEMQYKLAVAVAASCNTRGLSIRYLDAYSAYNVSAVKKDLSLTKPQERFASTALEYSATYLMVVQMDTALLTTFGPARLDHVEDEVKSASRIAWLLRNAFAHNPFAPTWKIYGQYVDQMYTVEGVITLRTSGLNGQLLNQKHYGGALSLLRLLQFIKLVVEEKSP